jgi:hypothetical protein
MGKLTLKQTCLTHLIHYLDVLLSVWEPGACTIIGFRGQTFRRMLGEQNNLGRMLWGRLYVSDSVFESPYDSVHDLHINGLGFRLSFKHQLQTLGCKLHCISPCAGDRTRNHTVDGHALVEIKNYSCIVIAASGVSEVRIKVIV